MAATNGGFQEAAATLKEVTAVAVKAVTDMHTKNYVLKEERKQLQKQQNRVVQHQRKTAESIFEALQQMTCLYTSHIHLDMCTCD